jgi:uncharacterized Ntn-hydrolase superfamily protein
VTYSVVAHDPATGEVGVAIQSHWFNVGQRCAWARSGAGVVATQALTDASYGRKGLALMAAGVDAPTALSALRASDPDAERRQVAMLDHRGGLAVHTGSLCLDHAGHRSGRLAGSMIASGIWSVQGNLLARADCIAAMATAMEEATGTLARRLLVALRAAESTGGDLRGAQSAAIRVLAPPVPKFDPTGTADDRFDRDLTGLDLWVADHEDPIEELERLLDLDEAYLALRLGGRAAERGAVEEAEYELSVVASGPHDVEIDFWRALHLDRLGHRDRAVALLLEVIRAEPTFAEVLQRLAVKVDVHAPVAAAVEAARAHDR